MKDKISIIVPVYNMEKYLEECILSLINQTYKNIEILIINDGSTDNSLNIINFYSKKDKRIKVISKKNEGISAARNDGIGNSTGELICFVDSDDYVGINYCEQLYQSYKENKSDIVVCDYYEKYEYTNTLKVKSVINFQCCHLSDNPCLLFEINSSPWNKLFKKNLFDNIKFPKLKYEDLAVVQSVLGKAKLISKVNIPLYYYRIRNNGETGTIDSKTQDILKVLDIIRNNYKNNSGLAEAVDFLCLQKCCIYILKQRFQKNYNTAIKNSDQFKNYIDKNVKKYKKNKYYRKLSIKHRITIRFYKILLYVVFLRRNKNEIK